MRTYRYSGTVPAQAGEEFARLETRLNEAQPSFRLQVLHAQPAKTKAGDLVYADGTDWNPGSGEGLYRRSADNTAWVFIG